MYRLGTPQTVARARGTGAFAGMRQRVSLAIIVALICAAVALVPVQSFAAGSTASRHHEELLKKNVVVLDAALHNYLMEIIARLSKGRPNIKKLPLLTIFNDNAINAFTTGQDYIYVYTGLMAVMQNEAELAMVLAHELSHGDLGHTSGGGMVLGALRQFAIGPLSRAAFSRLNEREADFIGLQYLADAGYDTSVGVKAFNRLGSLQSELRPGLWLRSHPLSKERLIVLSSLSQRYPGGKRVGADEYRENVLSRFK
jgi:beta-barrel assembly-enhancing protease